MGHRWTAAVASFWFSCFFIELIHMFRQQPYNPAFVINAVRGETIPTHRGPSFHVKAGRKYQVPGSFLNQYRKIVVRPTFLPAMLWLVPQSEMSPHESGWYQMVCGLDTKQHAWDSGMCQPNKKRQASTTVVYVDFTSPICGWIIYLLSLRLSYLWESSGKLIQEELCRRSHRIP